MNPRKQSMHDLDNAGYILKRHGSNHDIYYHPETGVIIPLKRHDFNENDRAYILKEIKQNEKKGRG